MLKLLSNGADPSPARPTPAGDRPGKTKAKPKTASSRAAMPATAQAAEELTLDLIRSQPGTSTAMIARATQAKVSSTQNRPRRLQGKGLIARGGDGAWTVL
jgi:hypothetical protein